MATVKQAGPAGAPLDLIHAQAETLNTDLASMISSAVVMLGWTAPDGIAVPE